MPNKSKGGRNSECNGDTRESFSFMICFAVGATKVPLHRRTIHRNSTWAHLNSASKMSPHNYISPWTLLTFLDYN